MSTVGQFEIVKEVACTAMVQVSRVKTAQKPDGTLVLKRCAPRGDGFLDCKPIVASFLEAARVQEAVGAKPGAHWAPVLERGEDDEGGYYLTHYYPRSAQKLIVGKFRLSGPGLDTLVSAILGALVELKDACGRQHGNLKATNVLIAGADEIEDRDIFLSDPADSSKPEANDGGADDLFQLGQLIHQLVLHRPFRAVTGWPVEPSEAWTKLGYSGNRWRDFCNHLLHPDPLSRPASLDEAHKELQRIGRRPLAFTLVRYAVAAAVVGAIAGGSWYYLQHRKIQGEVATLAREWNGWYKDFQVFTARDEFNRDAALKARLLPAVESADVSLRSLSFNDDLLKDPPGVFERSRREELRRAVAGIRGVQDVLKAWEFRQWLGKREQELREKRGWTAAADYLRARLEETEPVEGKHVGPAMTTLLQEKKEIEAVLEEGERAWATIQQNCARITAGAASAFPRKFAERAARAGKDLERPVPDAIALRSAFLAQLKEWEDRSTRFAAGIPAGWPQAVALERVKAEEQRLAPERFEAWLELLAKYRLQTLSAESMQALRRPLDETADKVAALDAFARTDEERKRLQALKETRAALEKELLEVAGLRFAQGDEVVQRKLRELDARIKTYRDGVANELTLPGREPANVWSAAAVAQFDDEESAIVREGWRRQFVAVAGADAASLSGARYVDVREKVAKWAAALRKVAPAFPPPAGMPEGPFRAAAAERRDAALREAVGLWERAAEPPGDEQWLAPVLQAYEGWLEETRSLAERYQAARDLLDAGAAADAKAPNGQTLAQLAEGLDAKGSGDVGALLSAVVREVGELRRKEEQVAALRGQVDDLHKKDQLAEALSLCDRILTLRPIDQDARRLKSELEARIRQRTGEFLAQAQGLLADGRYDAAVAALDGAAALSPKEPAVAVLRRKVDEAREQARQSAGVAALVQKANELVDRGRPRDALAELQKSQAPEAAARAETVRRLIAAAPAVAREGDQWFDSGNYREALARYQEAYRGGNAHAMFRLGLLYRGVRGVAPRPAESSALVAAAADLKDPEALHELAGTQPPNRPNRYLSDLAAAAQANDATAQFLYGDLMEAREGPERAVRWYRDASRAGHAEASFRLGTMYEEGRGVPAKNVKEAQRLYESASAQGHAEARERLQQMASANRSQTGGRGGRGGNRSKNEDLGKLFQQQ